MTSVAGGAPGEAQGAPTVKTAGAVPMACDPPAPAVAATPAAPAPAVAPTPATTTTTTMVSLTSVPAELPLPSATLHWLHLHFPDTPLSSPSPATLSGRSPSPSADAPGPSPALTRVFAAHRPDPSEAIRSIVRRLVARVLPPSATSGSMDPRADLALRLYWAMLENMTTSETERLTNLHAIKVAQTPPHLPPPPPLQLQFGLWLGSKNFHAAVLAVALEVVLYAHADPAALAAHANAGPGETPRIEGQLFPYVLTRMEVSSFDFLKLLEMSVRHLPTLLVGGNGASALPPPALKQYLARIQNECILWRIWAKDSPLLQVLEKQEQADAAAAAKAAEAATAAAAAAQANSSSTDESKSSQQNGAPATTSAVVLSSSPSPAPAASTSLFPAAVEHLLTKQLLTLAAQRLSSLLGSEGGGLNVGNIQLESCWHLLLEIFANHKNLLHDRHLDSVLLCVVYNICCKIASEANCVTERTDGVTGVKTALDFKAIIKTYLKMHEHNGHMVVRAVSTFHASSQQQPQQIQTSTSVETKSMNGVSDGKEASAGSLTAPVSSSTTTTPRSYVLFASSPESSATAAAVPSSSASVSSSVAGSTAADDSTHCNLILFYNRYFIHEIKSFALDVVKPRMIAAVAAAASAAAAAAAESAPAGATIPLKPPTRSPLNAQMGAASSSFGSPAVHAGVTLSAGAFSPSSIASYSPLRSSRSSTTNARFHPYAAQAPQPGSHTPIPPTSIHAYLSPRKAHMAAQHVYVSRMQQSPAMLPPTAVARSANAAVSASSHSSNGSSTLAPPPAGHLAPRLGLGRHIAASSAATAAEETALQLQVLAGFPASPAPSAPNSGSGSGASGAIAPVPPLHHHRPAYHSAPLHAVTGTGHSVPLTPKSQQLYAFGESPRQSLDDINARVAAGSALGLGVGGAGAHSHTLRVPIAAGAGLPFSPSTYASPLRAGVGVHSTSTGGSGGSTSTGGRAPGSGRASRALMFPGK